MNLYGEHRELDDVGVNVTRERAPATVTRLACGYDADALGGVWISVFGGSADQPAYISLSAEEADHVAALLTAAATKAREAKPEPATP